MNLSTENAVQITKAKIATILGCQISINRWRTIARTTASRLCAERAGAGLAG
jgi:hypothetical protein